MDQVVLVEYVGGPKDMVRETRPATPVDIAIGIRGTYWPTSRSIEPDGMPPAQVLEWEISPGGTKSAPSCKEPCSRGCPAALA